MRPLVLLMAFLPVLSATAMAQPALKPEVQAFELTPVAPPTLALKYQLLFQNAYDRHPGNAANLYLEAVELTTQNEIDQADKALDKYSAGDMAGFNSMADALESAGIDAGTRIGGPVRGLRLASACSVRRSNDIAAPSQ